MQTVACRKEGDRTKLRKGRFGYVLYTIPVIHIIYRHFKQSVAMRVKEDYISMISPSPHSAPPPCPPRSSLVISPILATYGIRNHLTYPRVAGVLDLFPVQCCAGHRLWFGARDVNLVPRNRRGFMRWETGCCFSQNRDAAFKLCAFVESKEKEGSWGNGNGFVSGAGLPS